LFDQQKTLAEKLTSMEVEPFENRWKHFLNAELNQKDTAMASKLYNQVMTEFYQNEKIHIKMLDFYEKNGQKQKAYDLCAYYLQGNPHTVQMLIKYIDLCIKTNITLFVEDTLNELAMMMDPSQHAILRKNTHQRMGIDDTTLLPIEE
jgi:hypothetical protein